ncbi:MAG: prephenate dehydratase [Chloroflexi bacterium]|nr:prephenate dehydratase [Chloroflexota bacterium]
MDTNNLETARAEIDQIDAEVVRLLNDRARLAQRIGTAKNSASKAIYAPDREHEVLANVTAAGADGPLTDRQLTAIYRQVISACRALERPIRIAYMGPAASFTHQAAVERFGDTTEFIPVASIPDTFAEVQRGDVDFGVVPVENSTDGPVHETLDNFVDAEVKICSEIMLPISFQLLSKAESREAIKTVYTNPVALAQCRGWLAKNLPTAEIMTVVSTSRAAAMAAEDPTTAGIANLLAAKEYGLKVIDAEIQDLSANYTRFYVIALAAANRPTGSDKTAIAFSIRDKVGALRDVADVFARRGISMSSIQSRPSRRRVWDYIFFVELRGHAAEPNVRDGLAELEGQCVFVKTLGSWPVDDN